MRMGFNGYDCANAGDNTHAQITHCASNGNAYLFHVDDAPTQRALGFYQEF